MRAQDGRARIASERARGASTQFMPFERGARPPMLRSAAGRRAQAASERGDDRGMRRVARATSSRCFRRRLRRRLWRRLREVRLHAAHDAPPYRMAGRQARARSSDPPRAPSGIRRGRPSRRHADHEREVLVCARAVRGRRESEVRARPECRVSRPCGRRRRSSRRDRGVARRRRRWHDDRRWRRRRLGRCRLARGTPVRSRYCKMRRRLARGAGQRRQQRKRHRGDGTRTWSSLEFVLDAHRAVGGPLTVSRNGGQLVQLRTLPRACPARHGFPAAAAKRRGAARRRALARWRDRERHASGRLGDGRRRLGVCDLRAGGGLAAAAGAVAGAGGTVVRRPGRTSAHSRERSRSLPGFWCGRST